MHILEISYRDPYGNDGAGVESYIIKLADFLKSNDNTVDIAYATETRSNPANPVEIYIPKIIWKIGLAKFYYNLRLYFIVRKNKSIYDILHINGDNGTMIPYIKQVKTVMTLHGSISETLHLKNLQMGPRYILSYVLDSIDGILEQMACRNSGTVISVSNHTADYFKNITGRTDIKIINTCIHGPNNINNNFQIIDNLRTSGNIICLWVGRDPVRKGLNIAKNAIRELNNITLVTAGYKDEVKQENVVNLGYVDNDLLQALYQITDILLFPSSNEGFSIGLLEAMSYGCVPIVFSIPSTIELLENGKSGFLVNNEKEFRETLISLIENRPALEKLKPAAIARASEYYCSKILPKILDLMDQLNQS